MKNYELINLFLERAGFLKDKAARTKIVKIALNYAENSLDESDKLFLQFCQNFKCAGFRKGKAPRNIMVRNFAEFEKCNEDFLIHLFYLWGKDNNKILDAIKDFFSDFENEIKDELKDEIVQDKNYDSLEDFIKKFLKNSEYDDFDKVKKLILYFLMLEDLAETELEYEKSTSMTEVSRNSKKDSLESKKNEKLTSEQWLSILSSISEIQSDSEAWDEFDRFIIEVKIIHSQKLKAKNDNSKLENAKKLREKLLSNYSDYIEFFEIHKLKEISFESIDINKLDKGIEFLIMLDDLFKSYNNIEAKSQIKGKTLQEEKERRKLIDQLSEIEEELLLQYNNFVSYLSDDADKENLKVEIQKDIEKDIDTEEIKKSVEESDREKIEKKKVSKPIQIRKEDEKPEMKDAKKKEKKIVLKPLQTSKEDEKPEKEDDKSEEKEKSVKKFQMDELDETQLLYPTSSTADEIAKDLKNKSGKSLILATNELVWSSIREGKISEAYWVNKHLSETNNTNVELLPSWLIEFIALSNNLQHSFGPIAPRMAELLSEYNENIYIGNEEWKNGIRFLLAGAMIRPSILAPTIGSSSILGSIRLKGELKSTYQICKAVADFGNQGQAISSVSLGTIHGQMNWKDQLDELISEANRWKKQAPKMSFIYSPANKIWKELLKSGNLIYEIINPICTNNLKKSLRVRELIEKYSNDTSLKNLISDTDRSIRKISKSSKAITGKGLTQIIGHCFEAYGIARKWIVLNEQKPDNENKWLIEQIEKLTDIFKLYTDDTIGELEAQIKNYRDSWNISTGVKVLQESIIDCKNLFVEGKTMYPQEELSNDTILNNVFLFIPSIRVDDKMVPLKMSLDTISDQIIKYLSDKKFNVEKIFKQYCSMKDHEKTEQIIDHLRVTLNDENVDKLEDLRQEAIDTCILSLKDSIEKIRRIIDEAVAQDLLSDIEYSGYISNIDLIDPESVKYFPAVFERLDNINEDIKKRKKIRFSEVSKRLKDGKYSDVERKKIEELLKNNDIGTAEEFLSLLDSGESLPEIGEKEDAFSRYFPDFINDFEDYMKVKRNNKSILNKIRLGTTFGPVKMKNVRGAQLEESIEPISKWLIAKQKRKISTKALSHLLTWIGFEIENCEDVESVKDRQIFKIKSKRVSLSPIPDYGSSAIGNYSIICFYGRPPEDIILDQISKNRREGALIALYFGRMTEAQYRNFANAIRKQTTGCLIIDESIIFYMVQERGSRLNRLFQLSLPFSNNNPYKPFATGNVPPEMFYGRHKEKESIIDPHGSCFIYGGRQLGKSALLRAVEREFSRPNDNHYAFFVDLKTEGIGETRPIDDIWKILIKYIHEYRILTDDDVTMDKPENVILNLIKWANADHSRRLMLLIDEADNLLDEDAKDNFIRITKMKKIMDDTERRVKFVFAGLHNVQRFIRIPNQPLAHLGDPICIGPLLNNGEWREAKNLIELPTSALGYRFNPPFLISRILSHTNYQPSLIQLFCDTLVKHLTDSNKAVFDQRKSPPYIITEKHVNDVYSSTSLRKNIKERFELTLNLDPRYLVISYIIAHGALNDEEEHQKGFGIPWISKEVNYWWSNGFEDSGSVDDLRGLLEEMTGLGVLIKTEDNRYKLRSPSVLRLLGNIDDIEHTLLSVNSWELPKKFKSSAFRRSEVQGDIIRSPLTGTQESDLLYRENGIRLIFGSKALGINNAIKYIILSKSDSYPLISKNLSPHASDLSRFLEEFEFFIGNRKVGINIFFIPNSAPYSEKWIQEAHQKIKKLRYKTSILRVIFIAEPETLRSWLKIPKSFRNEIETEYAPSVSLKRWNEHNVERWLNELSLAPNSPKQRDKIIDYTNGWPILLFKFAQFCLKKNMNWETSLDKLTDELHSPKGKNEFLDSIGIGDDTFENRIFKMWAVIGESLSIEELVTIVDEFSKEEIEMVLDYGEKLSLCKQIGDDNWVLEKFVAKLLL